MFDDPDGLLRRLRSLQRQGLIGQVLPVAYDWRLSNRYNAARLATIVEPALQRWRDSSPERADARLVFVGRSAENVFDYLTQLANVELGQSYLHASSFERDGQGVAMAAWGGVGKTTAMLKLVGEHGWRFLSDDLNLIRRASHR